MRGVCNKKSDNVSLKTYICLLLLMVIYDFIFEHDKLQLQSPSVLYVKDRSCKECGVV